MAALLSKHLGHDRAKEVLMRSVREVRLPQAFLFSGPSGVGKKMLSLGLVQALLCEEKNGPCGWCASCRKVESNQHENLLLISTTAAQIKLESVNEIREFLALRSWRGRCRAIVIDEAHKLNPQAANALLKSLEEPPQGTHFFLISSLAQALLATIRSRCFQMHLGALSHKDLRRLKSEAPEWVVTSAQGRVDRVEQLLNEELQPLRNQVFMTWEELLGGEAAVNIEGWRDFVRDRDSALDWVQFHLQLLRDALVVQSDASRILHRDKSLTLERLAQRSSAELLKFWSWARELEDDIRSNVDRGLAAESFLLKVQGALR